MRKRRVSFVLRLNDSEHSHLMKGVQSTGLPRETFIRSLILGYMPKPLPPPDYYAMMRELHAIGNNLNQLAAKANATGHLDSIVFQREADLLRESVQRIQQAVTAPEKQKSSNTPSP
ncbi:plasmid mobilization relaxosome protein MobC [Paenibacillus polymyxa]|uniref:plasmid mobilization protein n=1 Tax=Paenibacillus polymyxa TaxID=1406 RepID=UPI0008FCA51A|nr:plasmid mobilization relaxosome protein MobC [Paenibacillus polymyxa]APB72523.1 plasmid mobilization relaxosome protein MobC [Paenibacillus polymyxa]